ncbi:MAG: hypothetical protein LBL74_04545 [Bacteroidales bacterium]|jgi:hypothetical protein|nr:hypothetical protein [Bacteroidales bacterium]
MKHIIKINSIILLLVCGSCFAQKENNDYFITDNDNQKIVYLYPTPKQLDIAKEIDEEGFYVAADDANYYQYYAFKYLQENNIHYDSILLEHSIYLVKEKLFVPEEVGIFGCFFIYEKDKYKDFVSFVDIGTVWKFKNGSWIKEQ